MIAAKPSNVALPYQALAGAVIEKEALPVELGLGAKIG
jgi:hypothetical protein